MSTFHGGKLASLGEELKRLRPAPRKQTPEQIVAAMRAIRETLGG